MARDAFCDLGLDCDGGHELRNGSPWHDSSGDWHVLCCCYDSVMFYDCIDVTYHFEN